MCCCGKPVVNGQEGYSWDGKRFGVHPVNPPTLRDGEVLLYDEPGRCGGIDSHCHHYRLVSHGGTLQLLVKHGGGEERIDYLSNSKALRALFDAMDSNGRYWMLNAMWHAQSNAASEARRLEAAKWRNAAFEKRIVVKRRSGKVSIKQAAVA
jgi:hypothetical protein